MSSRIPPVSRIRPYGQFAITSAPITLPNGSLQSYPNVLADTRPMMASTDIHAKNEFFKRIGRTLPDVCY